MKENYYYLFGEVVVDAYNHCNLDSVIELIKQGYEYTLFHYKVDYNTLTDLLNAYEGHSSFTELDKLEYDTLQKAIIEL